jgi:hypothetical protein
MKHANRPLLFLLSGILFGCSSSPALQPPVPDIGAEPTQLAETTPTQAVYSPVEVGEGEGFNLRINFLADPNTACFRHWPYPRLGNRSFVPYHLMYADDEAYPYVLSCLDRDGWHVYDYDAFDSPEVPSDNFYHQSPPTWIFRCPDGRIYLEMWGDMYLDKDGTLFKVAETTPSGSGEFSCTAGNGFWSGGGGSPWVYHFDGKVTTQYHVSEFAGSVAHGNFATRSIAVAPNGSFWVAITNGIATFDGTTWQVFGTGNGFEKDPHPRGMVVDADGIVWAITDLGVLAYDGVRWSTIPGPEGRSEFILLDHENKAWIAVDGADSGYAFYKLDLQTNGWVQDINGAVFGGIHCRGNNIDALQFDRRGRLWVATCYGLYVYDGSRWTAYHTYTSGLYSNYATSLMVLGDGPQLPALAPKEPGAIHGRLMNPDAGTNTTLQAELCLDLDPLDFFLGATPCADQPFHPLTPLGADGSFVFTDVPVGKYFLVVQADQKNWMKVGILDVKLGEIIELGEFVYQLDPN